VRLVVAYNKTTDTHVLNVSLLYGFADKGATQPIDASRMEQYRGALATCQRQLTNLWAKRAA
jgi:hypothetical protein